MNVTIKYIKKLKNKFLKNKHIIIFRNRTLPKLEGVTINILQVLWWGFLIMLCLNLFHLQDIKLLLYIQSIALYFVVQELKAFYFRGKLL